MAHMSKLDLEEAETLAKLLRAVRTFDFALSDAVGDKCRQFPSMKLSVGTVRDALEDLQGDVRGTMKDKDPDNVTGWDELRSYLSRREAEART
ncbi:hypothetical protein Sp245p_26430 (plasmid) [Azospirillum baldaniorum]|uniref:Uncharacterized protein n=3 Tax=Azospirillum baldaniorum TaxID=1064539 RepID=A0A9P1JZT1_9PROT|nr:hypothetical protein Sp245p_25930 [Azospirillum baldaniorum]AWJ93361.1 hypothetical protein Sp245p_26430 [Azospirillum baldaniorum]TWA77960.1 hypothetical protein FBZ85_106120 [Azospirillum brasilense]CCD02940.1 protein of unknown function [Azospirillum baldaniorum]